jgi:hypothetical protein
MLDSVAGRLERLPGKDLKYGFELQSFRHHLSRLDSDDCDYEGDHIYYSAGENGSDVKVLVRRGGFRTTTYSSRSANATSGTRSCAGPSPFHLANRASDSLRMPKHIFTVSVHHRRCRSIPFCHPQRQQQQSLVVIRVPSSNPNDHQAHGPRPNSPRPSYFIGIFGRWYRSGTFEAWYHDVVYRSGDNQRGKGGTIGSGMGRRCRGGVWGYWGLRCWILGSMQVGFFCFATSRVLTVYICAGFPFSKPTPSNLPSSSKQRLPPVWGTPPKRRNQDRPAGAGEGA